MCCFWSIHTKTYHDRLASRLSIFSTDTLGSFFFSSFRLRSYTRKNHNKNQLKSKQYACHTYAPLLHVWHIWMLCHRVEMAKKRRGFLFTIRMPYAIFPFGLLLFHVFFFTEFLSAIDQINEIGDLVDCVHGVVMATISLHSSTFFFILPMTAKNKHLTKKGNNFCNALKAIRRVRFVF